MQTDMTADRIQRQIKDAIIDISKRAQSQGVKRNQLMGSIALSYADLIAVRQALTAPRVPDAVSKFREASEKGFSTSESCGPDGKYQSITKFRSLADLQDYERARIALLTTAQSPAEQQDELRFADARLLRRALQSIRLGDTADADKCIEVILDRSPDFAAKSPAEPAQDELAKPERNTYDKVIADQDAELAKLREISQKYHELLYQVAEKIPDQTRHETALSRLQAYNAQPPHPPVENRNDK